MCLGFRVLGGSGKLCTHYNGQGLLVNVAAWGKAVLDRGFADGRLLTLPTKTSPFPRASAAELSRVYRPHKV